MLVLAAPLAAETGGVVTTPPSGKPTATGLSMTVDTIWVDGAGYRPVEITVNSSPLATADHTISVDFKIPGIWNGRPR